MAISPTLTQIPLPDPPADRPRRWPTRDRRHPASLSLALAAAAVLLTGIFGVLAGRMLTTARAAQRSSPAAASALKLDVASLAGEPVGVVRSQLRQLGLVVRVVWEQTRLEPARTVVSVQPGWPAARGQCRHCDSGRSLASWSARIAVRAAAVGAMTAGAAVVTAGAGVATAGTAVATAAIEAAEDGPPAVRARSSRHQQDRQQALDRVRRIG